MSGFVQGHMGNRFAVEVQDGSKFGQYLDQDVCMLRQSLVY